MFDLNFISEPGIQKETSDANWSFLNKQNELEINKGSDSKQSKVFFIQRNSWINYAFVLIILCIIAVIAISNSHYTKVKSDLVMLNQVIALIDECSYIKTLQLQEATFLMDQIKVTIRSEDFTSIQALSHDYRLENEIPYAMYQKGKYSYLNLIFPWKGNGKSGDITILESMANNILFSNTASINHSKDIFHIQGEASDIISFLLKMAENNQIKKFNFSIFHQDSGQFNLKVQLHLI